MRIKDFEIKKKYATLAFKWCKKKFGICKRKKRKLIFEFTKRFGSWKGYPIYGRFCFYRNKIIIYEPMCFTLHDIISTVIHEYTHYLQSGSQYKKYELNYYYSTNPYERQAKKYEKIYTQECLKDIRKTLKNL